MELQPGTRQFNQCDYVCGLSTCDERQSVSLSIILFQSIAKFAGKHPQSPQAVGMDALGFGWRMVCNFKLVV